ADDGVVDLDSGARPPVDGDRRVPDGRRAADHPGGDRLVSRQGALPVEAEQLAKLLILTLGALRRGELGAELLHLRVEIAVLPPRLAALVDPVDQVASGLQGPAGARLDRRTHRVY